MTAGGNVTCLGNPVTDANTQIFRKMFNDRLSELHKFCYLPNRRLLPGSCKYSEKCL